MGRVNVGAEQVIQITIYYASNIQLRVKHFMHTKHVACSAHVGSNHIPGQLSSSSAITILLCVTISVNNIIIILHTDNSFYCILVHMMLIVNMCIYIYIYIHYVYIYIYI